MFVSGGLSLSFSTEKGRESLQNQTKLKEYEKNKHRTALMGDSP